MENRPLLSVLLVTYNHEAFIRRALDGALMQKTGFPFEIVIGEDASTDNTRAICEEYNRKYPDQIRLINSAENVGLNQNFIRTLEVCRGKYVAYLEGDDWWITDDKLRKQVEILETQPDVVLVHTNCKLLDIESGRLQDHHIRFDGVCIREKKSGIDGVIAEFEGCFRPIKTSTACYRREIMADILAADEYLFSNPEFSTQDFQLFQEMCLRGKFVFIDEDTTVIGFHDSISAAKDKIKQVKFRFGFFLIGLYLIDKYKLPRYAIDIWIQKELYFFFKDAFERKDRTYILKALSESAKRGYHLPFRQWVKAQVVKYVI
ncbi:MAG: glycosyltransferase family 2 protein [Bacteroidota bacterium]|nr:glycosyltransferase family 2 protein [Bacteroidota bacterium]